MEKRENTAVEQPSFEQCLERIQAVVKLLESGKLPLEESLRLFEEGIGLVRCCQERLQQAELKVEMLLPGTDGQLVRKPFAVPEEE